VTIAARLSDATGRFLQLEVVGYEFAIAGGDVNRMGVVEVGGSDANWLMVKLQAGDGETSWRSVSPALEDYDLPRLVIWLRSLADGLESVDSARGATEPNLRLVGAVDGPNRVVRVELSQEWRRPGTEIEDDPTVLELRVTPTAVLEFAAELEETSTRYPMRGLE